MRRNSRRKIGKEDLKYNRNQLIFFRCLFTGIQWTYQTCNEFGFYQTSDNKERIFGDRFPLVFFVKQCTDIYGHEFNADYLFSSINQTNKFYLGLQPNTTNVIYVHGSIDPWHALGIFESNDSKLPSIYIEGKKNKKIELNWLFEQFCTGRNWVHLNIHIYFFSFFHRRNGSLRQYV